MKKTGFTLAEVLITLTIIGVVATLTLPSLMTNTAEQQARTALKKIINTLTEAGEMNRAVDNFAYSDVVKLDKIDADSIDTQSLYAILAKRTNVDFTKGAATAPDPAPIDITPKVNTYLYLRDGTAIYFDKTVIGNNSTYGAMQNDGLPLGYDIIVDTNGAKGPNILSNCNSKIAGENEGGIEDNIIKNIKQDGSESQVDITDCNEKQKRIIKDQFLVRLRGAQAFPSGYASRWAYNN